MYYRLIAISAVLLSSVITAEGVAAAGRGSGGVDSSRLDRYLEIAERAPFGEISPSEEAPQVSTAPPQTFAQNLEMRAIIDDGETIRVGFLDTRQQKNFYLALGESVDGIELISVDYHNEEALLRKGQETSLFAFRKSGARDASAPETPEQARAPSPRRRPLFANLARERPPGPDSAAARREIPSPFHGKSIEAFMRDHPDAAARHPSPLRPPEIPEGAGDRGATIERFLRENPDAVRRFSPFQPVDPSSRVEGRHEVIERFIREHSSEDGQMQAPVPFVTTPESVPFLFEGISADDLLFE